MVFKLHYFCVLQVHAGFRGKKGTGQLALLRGQPRSGVGCRRKDQKGRQGLRRKIKKIQQSK
jgi:hypothetical protein